jgi:hypothetical protein
MKTKINVIIPIALVTSDELSLAAKIVYAVLKTFQTGKTVAHLNPSIVVTHAKIMQIGSLRAWRATLSDAYSQADPKKPIYPVRTSFATCTDYKKAISKRIMERIYDCFYHKAGGWQCTQTGESGALATKDKKEYIQKQ